MQIQLSVLVYHNTDIMIKISFAVFPGPYVTPVKCILTEYAYIMMNAIMLSIYPGSDMTPVVHKHLFDLGKHIHRKTQIDKLTMEKNVHKRK